MPGPIDSRNSRAGDRQIAPTATAADGPETRSIRVSELLRNERQVILVHAGENYVLRITAKGKLILTK